MLHCSDSIDVAVRCTGVWCLIIAARVVPGESCRQTSMHRELTCSLSPVYADSGVPAMLLRRREAMAEPLDTLCGDVTPPQPLGDSRALRVSRLPHSLLVGRYRTTGSVKQPTSYRAINARA